jgi:ribosomal protein L37AE/L43A
MLAICPVCESELNIKRSGLFECEMCGLADHEANLDKYEEEKQ